MKNSIKKVRKIKGFTLVELLSVIIILAILMIIAIPAVLDTIISSRKTAFVEYAEKVRNLGEQKHLKNKIDNDYETECIMYDIETDLDLSTTGGFHGYVLVLIGDEEDEYYLTLYNSNFMIYGVNIDNNFNTDSLIPFTNSDDENLSKETLAQLARCDRFTNVDDGTDVDVPEPEPEPPKTKYAHLLTGYEINDIFHKYFRVTTLPWGKQYYIKRYKGEDYKTTDVLSEPDSEYPVYFWVDDDTQSAYYYSEADVIYLNEDSSYMFDEVQFLGFDLDGWDSSRVISMSHMFFFVNSVSVLDLTWMDTSNVESMDYMFCNYGELNTEIQLNEIKVSKSKWKISNVINYNYMFHGRKTLTNNAGYDVSNPYCSTLSDYTKRYYGCSSLMDITHAKDRSEGGILTVVEE